MREDWIETEIGDVAKLYQPKTISPKMLVADGKYDVYGANGIIGKYDKFNHEEEESQSNKQKTPYHTHDRTSHKTKNVWKQCGKKR